MEAFTLTLSGITFNRHWKRQVMLCSEEYEESLCDYWIEKIREQKGISNAKEIILSLRDNIWMLRGLNMKEDDLHTNTPLEYKTQLFSDFFTLICTIPADYLGTCISRRYVNSPQGSIRFNDVQYLDLSPENFVQTFEVLQDENHRLMYTLKAINEDKDITQCHDTIFRDSEIGKLDQRQKRQVNRLLKSTYMRLWVKLRFIVLGYYVVMSFEHLELEDKFYLLATNRKNFLLDEFFELEPFVQFCKNARDPSTATPKRMYRTALLDKLCEAYGVKSFLEANREQPP